MKLAWEKLSERLEKVGYRWVTHKTYRMPDGTTGDFTTTGEGGQSAAVFAVTKSGKIVIARQYRPGPDKILDELPGGSVDRAETPEAAARRELLEETGYTTDGEILFVGHGYRDAYKNEIDNYYIAYDCYRAAKPQLEPTEFIETKEIEVDELLGNARAGKMSDAMGVLLAYDKLMEVRDGEKRTSESY